MTFRYVVAGMCVHAPEPIAGLSNVGESDGDIMLQWCADEEIDCGKWYALPDHIANSVCIAPDGATIRVPQLDAVSVRQAVPFAAALQGKMTLHSAAVVWGEKTIAFVAPSGTGKSTLAEALSQRDIIVIADDLLACRERGSQVVSWPGGYPLSVIYVMRRVQPIDAVQIRPLASKQALQHLIKHGFGELSVPEIWRRQFAFYSYLAQELAAFDLIVPDKLDQLPQVIERLIAHWDNIL